MPYEIIIEERGYLKIIIKGNFGLELARVFALESHILGETSNIHRFLFDVREASNSENVIKNAEYMNVETKEMQLDKNAKSAVVANIGDHSHDFLNDRNSNGGFNIRVFYDFDSAEQWLLSE